MTTGPGAPSRVGADGLYVWRPPNCATASVAVQSRWGNLYNAPATVRSLAVDVYRRAHVYADIAAPTDAPVADRLPGQSLRLRVLNMPTPPFRGRYRVLLSLGEVTDLVTAHVALTPCLEPAGDGMQVLITAAASGAVFGLAHPQASRPPNVVKQAARMIRLLVDATAAQTICEPRFPRAVIQLRPRESDCAGRVPQGPTRDSHGGDPRRRARQWCHWQGERHNHEQSSSRSLEDSMS
jgi:hypothetical protein